MLKEQNNIDLSLLKENFTEDIDYDKETILKELEYWQKNEKDFLVITHGDIDGFLIAYRNRKSLFIAQVWHRKEIDLIIGRQAMNYAKQWAKKRGMMSITFETGRNEMKALERYGFKEFSLILRCELNG